MADIEGEYLYPVRSLCFEKFQVDSVRTVYFEGKVKVLGSISSPEFPQSP
jgi:hypothetical protein